MLHIATVRLRHCHVLLADEVPSYDLVADAFHIAYREMSREYPYFGACNQMSGKEWWRLVVFRTFCKAGYKYCTKIAFHHLQLALTSRSSASRRSSTVSCSRRSTTRLGPAPRTAPSPILTSSCLGRGVVASVSASFRIRATATECASYRSSAFPSTLTL